MPGICTVFPCPSCLRPQCTTNGVRSGRARYCPCSRATLRTILSSRRGIVSKQCYAWCMLHLQTGSCSRRLRVLLAIWHQMLSGFSCRRAAEPGSHDRYLRNAVTPPLVGELREAKVLSTKIRINVVTGPVSIAGTRAMYTLFWKFWIRAYRTLTLCSSCFVLTNKVRLSSTLLPLPHPLPLPNVVQESLFVLWVMVAQLSAAWL